MTFDDEIYVELVAMGYRAENRVRAAQAVERTARAEGIRLGEAALTMADALGRYEHGDAVHARLVALAERAKKIVKKENE